MRMHAKNAFFVYVRGQSVFKRSSLKNFENLQFKLDCAWRAPLDSKVIEAKCSLVSFIICAHSDALLVSWPVVWSLVALVTVATDYSVTCQ